MSALLRQRRTSSIIVAFLSIVLGVVLVMYPDKAASIFVKVCGYALIALGVYYIVVYFARKSKVAMCTCPSLMIRLRPTFSPPPKLFTRYSHQRRFISHMALSGPFVI